MNIAEAIAKVPGLQPNPAATVLVIGEALALPMFHKHFHASYFGAEYELPSENLDLMEPVSTFSLVILSSLDEFDHPLPVNFDYWGVTEMNAMDVVIRLASRCVGPHGLFLYPEDAPVLLDDSFDIVAPGIATRGRCKMQSPPKEHQGFVLKPVAVSLGMLPGRILATDDVLLPELRQGSNFFQLRLPVGDVATGWLQHLIHLSGVPRQFTDTLRLFQSRMREDLIVQQAAKGVEQLEAFLDVKDLFVTDGAFNRLRKRNNQLKRETMPYPERASLENRYHVLGKGTRFRQGEKLFEVDYFHVERGSNKPPKLYLEELNA